MYTIFQHTHAHTLGQYTHTYTRTPTLFSMMGGTGGAGGMVLGVGRGESALLAATQVFFATVPLAETIIIIIMIIIIIIIVIIIIMIIAVSFFFTQLRVI